ncbi:MAG: hypothetical protein ACMUIP_08960, partial [bacterium]
MLALEEARKLAEKIILDNYAPPCVLINEKYDISYFIGCTDKYLSPPPGEPSFNILKMARENIISILNVMIPQAVHEKKIIIHEGIHIQDNHGIRTVSLIVRPLIESNSSKCLMLVLFDDKSPAQKGFEQAESSQEVLSSAHQESLSLEEELRVTKEDQRRTNEELVQIKAELQEKCAQLQNSQKELARFKDGQQVTYEKSALVIEGLQKKVDELQKYKESYQWANEELVKTKMELDINKEKLEDSNEADKS